VKLVNIRRSHRRPDIATSEMAQSYLLVIPEELVAEICSHLCWHCQSEHALFKWPSATTSTDELKDLRLGLRSLALAHTRLQRIAMPFLHHYLETSVVGQSALFPSLEISGGPLLWP
jgi:hypothetical protein